MADPVTDPVAEHDARYGEEGAGPPEWARVRDRWRVPGSPGSRRRGGHRRTIDRLAEAHHECASMSPISPRPA